MTIGAGGVGLARRSPQRWLGIGKQRASYRISLAFSAQTQRVVFEIGSSHPRHSSLVREHGRGSFRRAHLPESTTRRATSSAKCPRPVTGSAQKNAHYLPSFWQLA